MGKSLTEGPATREWGRKGNHILSYINMIHRNAPGLRRTIPEDECFPDDDDDGRQREIGRLLASI